MACRIIDFFHLTNAVKMKTKKEGEECGPCFSPATNFFCGACNEGLECVKNPDSSIPDAPARCKKKIPRKEGEYCGPCSSGVEKSFCGDCDVGLRCAKDSNDYGRTKCQKKSGSLIIIVFQFLTINYILV